MSHKIHFPFTAIVGQEDFKLCLLLNLIDPTIGGVLATGDKGTGKTTLVRALSQLMGETFPFVNLPIGATEDRVLGSIDLEQLINNKRTTLHKGLLTQAHHGFLYIDEVNLLNDYLMDVLLDASASGGYHLEREGISEWMNSRFCLVGTMNPEEGALRPQLLDRFGLSVQIKTSIEIDERKQIAKQRLLFDTDPTVFINKYTSEEMSLQQRIINAKENVKKIAIPEEIQEAVATLTIANQVEGMRADILLLKTVRAYAAYIGVTEITHEMLVKIAPFVLLHRSKEYTPPTDPNQEEQNNQDTTSQESEEKEETQQPSPQSSFQLPTSVQEGLKFSIQEASKKKEISLNTLDELKIVPYQAEKSREIAIIASVKNYLIKDKFTPIHKQVTKKSMAHIVFLIDTSASMAIQKQIAYVKGMLQKTITSHPSQKVHYAIVGLADKTATVLQEFTTNIEKVLDENYKLKVGGKTNLGSAFLKVYELIRSINSKTLQLFILTDGKANIGGQDPFKYAIEMYKTYLGKLKNTTVIDTEQGFVRLGKAKELAKHLQLTYRTI